MRNSRVTFAAIVLAVAPLLALAQQPSGDATKGAAAKGPPTEVSTSMCTGCHSIPGYQASFPQVYRVPMIAGQHQDYIVAALQAYKKGERSHPTMRGIAQALTDEEINSLAAYYASIGTHAAPAKK